MSNSKLRLQIGRKPINAGGEIMVRIMQGSTVLRWRTFLTTGEQLKSDARKWFEEVQHALINERAEAAPASGRTMSAEHPEPAWLAGNPKPAPATVGEQYAAKLRANAEPVQAGSEHTPGKWFIEGDAIWGGYGPGSNGVKRVCIPCATVASGPDAEYEANRALIAAAPELLAERDALREAVKDALAWTETDLVAFEDITPNITMLEARIETLRAALAKVEGGKHD